MIVAHEVTNVGSDRDQLSSMAKQAREAMASDTLSVVADRGYFKGEQILACHDAGCLLLKNEIQELNLLLSKARADIFGLVSMLSEAQAKKDEFAGYLRLRGAEAAAMRKEIADLITSASSNKREAEGLRRIVNEMRPRPTTIV